MFTDSEPTSPLPDTFFRKLLSQIDSTGELKVTVYALWRVGHMDAPFRPLAESDFSPLELGLAAEDIAAALEAACRRGSLLKAEHEGRALYFINSPQDRSAAAAFAQSGLAASSEVSSAPLERSNVFRLYEENIGPLTPLIADALNDAERSYASEWVAEAIELAVKHNKRSWRYCEAILRRWKEEGRAEKQSGRDDQASRQRDVEDKIKKFIDGAG